MISCIILAHCFQFMGRWSGFAPLGDSGTMTSQNTRSSSSVQTFPPMVMRWGSGSRGKKPLVVKDNSSTNLVREGGFGKINQGRRETK